MSTKYLLIDELAVDESLRLRDFNNDRVPSSTQYFRRKELGDVLILTCGNRQSENFLALISLEALRQLPDTPDYVYSRISRVLKQASRPPIHLPRGWAEFHHKNKLAFFATPEEIGSQRWLAEVDGGAKTVYFAEVTDDKYQVILSHWTPPSLPSLAEALAWIEEQSPIAQEAQEATSFSEQVDMQVIGSEAVTHGRTAEEWSKELSEKQKKIVNAMPNSSMRIIGPAGSGKTLTLCLRALHLCRNATVIAERRKILVLTHSWAMAERIDSTLSVLNGGKSVAEVDVLPLLTVLQFHARAAGGGIGSVLGEDSTEGRKRMFELIERSLADEVFRNSIEHKDELSPSIAKALQAGQNSAYRRELIIDLYDEIVGVLSSQNIFPGDSMRLAEYLTSTRDDTLPPFKTRADREFCLKVFGRILETLVDMGAVTTDQFVMDSIRVLETFTWNVKRQTDGYDYILIDELQLFDTQERWAISLLSRSRDGMVFLSVEDPSQGMFSGLNDRRNTIKAKEQIFLSSTHRFKPGIFEFIAYLYKKFPLNATPITISRVDDQKSKKKPRIYSVSDIHGAVTICLDRIKKINESKERDRRLCIVTIGPVEDQLEGALNSAGVSSLVHLKGYDDVERLTYQKKSIVMSSWQFIGGTQFSDVILVMAYSPKPGSAYAQEREMTAVYLGSSRAASTLDIVCDMRVPDVLDSALKKRLLIRGEMSEFADAKVAKRSSKERPSKERPSKVKSA